MKNSKAILALSSVLFCVSTAYATEPAASTTSPTTTPAPVTHTMAVTPQPTEAIPPKVEVTTLVQEAVKYAKEHGDEAAFKEFNRPDSPFKKTNTYIFAIDFKGNILAHGSDAEVVGKNHYDYKDSKGRSVVRALIEKARYGDGAWVSYYWKNPETKADECKSSFVTTVDKKFVVGAGFHHPVDAKGKCEIE